MNILELIKNILEEKGPCTIEELLRYLWDSGINIDMKQLIEIINSHPELFKWTPELINNGKVLIPMKVTLTGGVVKLPPNQNPNQ